MKHTRLVIALSLALLGSASASETPPWPMPPMSYFVDRIPAPPREGDAADLSDLEYVLAVQACATKKQIAHAQLTAPLDPYVIFSEVLGPKFTPNRFPLTGKLLAKVRDTGEAVKEKLKAHYARKRPVDAHERDGVVSYVPRDKSFSYPSGHALRGWLTALVLSQLDPEKKHQLMLCGAAVGSDRVVAGVHYQTDIMASRAVARLIFDQLMKNPDFVAELDAVRKAEWTR